MGVVWKPPACAFIFSSFLLIGCDASKTASNANFAKALRSYYDNHPICVSLAVALPVELETGAIEPMRPQLEALTSAGVLSATTIRKPKIALSEASQPADYTRYSVNPGDERFVRQGTDSFLGGTDLCFARRRITRIESFTTPAEMLGKKVSQVTYDFELVDIAPWAGTAEVSIGFPGIKAMLAKSPDTQTDAMVLADTGWKEARDAQ